jgi:hypothetical protein
MWTAPVAGDLAAGDTGASSGMRHLTGPPRVVYRKKGGRGAGGGVNLPRGPGVRRFPHDADRPGLERSAARRGARTPLAGYRFREGGHPRVTGRGHLLAWPHPASPEAWSGLPVRPDAGLPKPLVSLFVNLEQELEDPAVEAGSLRHVFIRFLTWSGGRDSNPRHPAWELDIGNIVPTCRSGPPVDQAVR